MHCVYKVTVTYNTHMGAMVATMAPILIDSGHIYIAPVVFMISNIARREFRGGGLGL